VSAASQCKGPGSLTGQSKWDLWRRALRWGFLQGFHFPLSIVIFSVKTLHYLTNQLRVSATVSSHHQADSRNMKSKITGIESVLFLSFYILGNGLVMANKGGWNL
jgi:hypothetical protein